MQSPALRSRFESASALGSPAVEFAGVLVVVLATSVWATLVRDAAAAFAPSTTSPVVVLSYPAFTGYVLGVGLASVAYLRLRGLPVALSRPSSPAALVALVAPAALVFVAVLAGDALGTPVDTAINPRRYAPVVSLRDVLPTVAVPAVFVAAGRALLVCGVVHETVRRRVAGGPRALALTTALAAVVQFYPLGVDGVGSLFESAAYEPARFVLLAVGMLAAVCLGFALGLAYRAVDARDWEAAVAVRYAPAYAVAVVGVGVLALDPGTVVDDLLSVVAFAAAAFGYDRSGSLWVAVGSLAAFETAVGVVPVVV